MTSAVSFQRELKRMFERDQRVIEDFFSRRKLVEWFRVQALIDYSVEGIPEAIGEMGLALKSEMLAFYYRFEEEKELKLSQFYHRQLKGTVLLPKEESDTTNFLYFKDKGGQIASKIIEKQPVPFPVKFKKNQHPYALRVEGGKLLWIITFPFFSQFEIDNYALKAGDLLGQFILAKPLELNLDEIGQDMGVHFNLYTIDGKMEQGLIEFPDLDLENTVFSSDTVITLKDQSGEKYNGLLLPLTYLGTNIGYLSASISQKETTQKVSEIIIVLLLIALGIFISVLALSWFIFIRFTRPIIGLTKASTAIAQGDLNQDIEIIGNDELGTLASSFAHMRDSVRNQIQELQKMDRLKDEFLANTSHELRTPLHGIVGLAEAMMSNTDESSRERHQLSMIANSGHRLSRLINDLLDFYKMKDHGIRLQKDLILLQNLSESVITFSKPLVRERPIELINEVPPDFPPLYVDENRLEQILFNLVNNAIKFTEKGFIKIQASVVEDKAKISVLDSGIGIPEDQQERVFDVFNQVDGSISREQVGTGLGLSITKKLVELHDGTLELESQVNQGTCLSFTMELAKEYEKRVQQNISNDRLFDLKDRFIDHLLPQTHLQEQPFENEARETGKTILAVDDEMVNLEILGSVLSSAGYRLILASGGEEALELIQKDTPDLILLDLMMPRMSGYELCRIIRTRWDLMALPIIILTAKNQLRDLEEGFEAGANDFMTKPFHAKEILARIRTQILAKEAYLQVRENEQLKEEIQHRKQLEHDLQQAQKRLTKILDEEENGIVCLNREGTIVFCNKAIGFISGHPPQTIKGAPNTILFMDLDFHHELKPLFHSQEKKVIPTQIRLKQGGWQDIIIYVSVITMENESLMTLICSRSPSFTEGAPSKEENGDLSLPSHSNLMNNVDQRLFALEQAVKGMISTVSGNVGDRLIESSLIQEYRDPIEEDLRDAITKVMTLALNYWETSTNKTKIELAEESQIWHVNIDDGSFKTRTLNRYLNVKTLPKKPRVQEVIRTANFVLEHCPTLPSQKTILEQAVYKLQFIQRHFQGH
ncbi:MAG: response regulator [SAR324 cluster bacterium]|nr:response regulator [SAR324 cluster bacterium]